MLGDKHRGEIVKEVIKKNKISIKLIASGLMISRNTVYNKLRERNLGYDVILRIGEIANYDFSLDFPEIKGISNITTSRNYVSELWTVEQKYTHLLERYNKVLSFLLKYASDNKLKALKEELERFFKNTYTGGVCGQYLSFKESN